jgi:predicted nucleic acid-binding protein
MRTPRIYIETSVFNRYFEENISGHAETVKLFEEIETGKYKAYTSTYVIYELERTKDDKKRLSMLALISDYNIEVITGDHEADRLTNIYVNEGVVPATKRLDGLHIAAATINELDYIFSFNFRHINRVRTKTLTALVNAKEGYKAITIATPWEVVEYGDDE